MDGKKRTEAKIRREFESLQIWILKFHDTWKKLLSRRFYGQ